MEALEGADLEEDRAEADSVEAASAAATEEALVALIIMDRTDIGDHADPFSVVGIIARITAEAVALAACLDFLCSL